MSHHNVEIVLRLVMALLAGACIGYERSYHGRPAGFRTHTLVCTASSLLMLVTVYDDHWMNMTTEFIRLDPTRMAQGIMTGIGFLGAGVIIKEGMSVRGLTTAASIWMTSAIGILAGIGFYFPLAIAVFMTLGVLASFRWIERKMPAQIFYQFDVYFARNASMNEYELRKLIERNGFSVANFAYQMERKDRIRRHSMILRTLDRDNASRLYNFLEGDESVLKFRIIPTGDK
ncbi:MAG: MgtC/SapB family protein [Deltaproteobacteria bacterium]|jgi:putative Mg2+ transporter-C (MgtC) family protein|nr:MgtC/SapB family protein [Deltaproteobacteria bacterium]MBW2504548.1 MgtC/SapB family protein [Deltaproteobacteria bacterium]MBW2519207.1 MgtC/SapB family protein [Deltaproteobacteria bacterium]